MKRPAATGYFMNDQNSMAEPVTSVRSTRLGWLDAWRGVALVAMASYHFTWDLDHFGYLERGTAGSYSLRIYAHAIAGTFLFLAGASLYLSHGKAIRWTPFWTRFAKVAGGALAVTAATLVIMRDEFIYFGILHNIALASLIGLLFLRAPVALTYLVSALLIAAPYFLKSPAFNTPALYWVGLSETVRRSNDYVPLIPWLGPLLAGIASAKLVVITNRTHWFVAEKAESWGVFRWLSTGGRHSLAFYLLHQPILFGVVWCFSQVHPAASPDPAISYTRDCVMACKADRGESFCNAFCGCTLTALKDQNLFDALNKGKLDVNNDARVLGISRQCTRSAQGLE